MVWEAYNSIMIIMLVLRASSIGCRHLCGMTFISWQLLDTSYLRIFVYRSAVVEWNPEENISHMFIDNFHLTLHRSCDLTMEPCISWIPSIAAFKVIVFIRERVGTVKALMLLFSRCIVRSRIRPENKNPDSNGVQESVKFPKQNYSYNTNRK